MTGTHGPALGAASQGGTARGDLQGVALREAIRGRALALGFARAGFATAAHLPHGDVLRAWAARGLCAAMQHMARDEDRADPRALLPGAQSLIAVAARYGTGAAEPAHAERGAIARYARGPDYHVVLRERLARLRQDIAALAGPTALEGRIAVDTTPLLEREAAMAAGIGFIGKNTLLISPGIGSFTVLGVLLLPIALPADPPGRARCGRCTLCLRACPTGALAAPFVVDARRCVAYQTIEHRGAVDPALRPGIGQAVFGCDACQVACPYNAPTARSLATGIDLGLAPADGPAAASIGLAELLSLHAGGYRRLTRGRALRRTPATALRRNAAIAAGNTGEVSPALRNALGAAAEDRDPTVREAARFALSRLAEDDPTA